MATVTVPNLFVSGTLAKSSEVNANFALLQQFIQNELIQKDGSLAFTAVPSGPALDPTSANQLVRKDYVDGAVKTFVPTWGNVTLGTGGTKDGRYWQIGKAAFIIARFTLGTGGNVTSTIHLDWAGLGPPAAHSDFNLIQAPVATAWADDSNLRHGGVGIFADGLLSRVSRFVGEADAIGWGTTVPFDWAAGNSLRVAVYYTTV